MTGWHSWTSSPLLQLLLLYRHLPRNCQLRSITYSARLPTEDIRAGRERHRLVCKVSSCQLFKDYDATQFPHCGKTNETATDREVSIHHGASFSVSAFGSLILSEWQDGGSVYNIKLFDPLRWPRSPASAFVSFSLITNHIRRWQTETPS